MNLLRADIPAGGTSTITVYRQDFFLKPPFHVYLITLAVVSNVVWALRSASGNRGHLANTEKQP